MTDAALLQLAEASGASPRWKDVYGEWHDVAPDTLRVVLAALGIPAGSANEVADSLQSASQPRATLPPLITAEVGRPVVLATRPGP